LSTFITYTRGFKLFFVVLILLAFFPVIQVSAESATETTRPVPRANIFIGNNPVDYTGFEIIPDYKRPLTYALAVRPIAEAAGFTVTWSPGGTVLRSPVLPGGGSGNEIHIREGWDYFIRVCPREGRLTVPFLGSVLFLYEGRMYLNVDALAEMLGFVFIETFVETVNGEEEIWRFLPLNEIFETRYRHNAAILQSGGFIYGQNTQPVRSLQIGSRGNGGNHGCGPIAVHNALYYLGAENSRTNPARVIRFLDYNGGIQLSGLAGTNPEVLTRFIRREGYDATVHYLPEDMDDKIRASGVSILLYGRVRGGFFVHYTMIRHEAGYFYVYNEFGNDTRPRVYGSVDSLIVSREYRAVALITIP
jgi:hypothetical protein